MNRIVPAIADDGHGPVAGALRRFVARTEKRESGQALIIVMIAILLLVLIAPIVVSQSISEDNSVAVAANFEAALAAAEAGVQQYQNYLDEFSDYWKYNSTGVPPDPVNDPALAAGGWSTITGSSPVESFHYIPNTTFLGKGVGAGTAEVLLSVTGRAGVPGHYVYRTIQVTLASKGLLSNAYFSQYETLDWHQDTAPVIVTTTSALTGCTVTKNSETVGGNLGGCDLASVVPQDTVTGANIPGGTVVTAESTTGTTTSMTLSNNATPASATESLTIGQPVTYSVGPQGPAYNGAPPINGQTVWQALCQYETYQPNTFIDSLGTLTPTQGIANPYVAGNPVYSATYPYYGPFRGNDPNSGANINTYTYTYPNGETLSVVDPCGPVFNFVSGENFTGPVYTNDQLWVCGTPSLTGGLTSGIPVGFNYAYSTWPGNETGVIGTNGWIDDLAIQNWDGSCGGGGASNPSFGGKQIIDGGTDVLPPVDTSLSTAASSAGCLYSGPTMIEFVAGGTFNVWSPYSSGANGLAPPAAQCGTFSAASPMATGLTIPTAGLVIYVQTVPSATPPVALIPPSALGLGTNGGLPTGATCSNPWKPYAPASICAAAVGEEGDTIVEGELQGEVTIGSSNSIVVSRDLTYECADANSTPTGVTAQESATYVLPTACSSEANPDVLGLAATDDVVISHPGAGAIPPTNGYTYVEPASGTFTLSCNGTATASITYNAPATGAGSVQNALNADSACSGAVVTDPPTPGYLITLPQTVVLISSTGNMSSPANSDDVVNLTTSTGNQTEPYEWPSTASSQYCTTDGTEASQPATAAGLVADIFPNCMIQNPVIDGAIVSVQGSLADEDWDIGPNTAGGAYVQGTDVSFMRGPFGLGGTSGYSKEFSYDSRLTYLTPPSMIDIADLTWESNSFVNCGSVNDGAYPFPGVTPPATPTIAQLCPGLDWLNN
jgi:hypothetical protein